MDARSTTRRGFTLIELMIAIAILAVLASIAIPRYVQYVYRARSAEATTMLGVIRQQQYAYYAVNDCFAVTGQAPAGPPTNVPQLYNPGNSGLTPCSAGPVTLRDMGFEPNTATLYYVYQCAAQVSALLGGLVTNEFTCNARGDIDGDAVEAEWLYCTDFDNDGLGLNSPGPSNAVCSFPSGVYRVSAEIF